MYKNIFVWISFIGGFSLLSYITTNFFWLVSYHFSVNKALIVFKLFCGAPCLLFKLLKVKTTFWNKVLNDLADFSKLQEWITFRWIHPIVVWSPIKTQKWFLQNPTLCPGADIFARPAQKALTAWPLQNSHSPHSHLSLFLILFQPVHVWNKKKTKRWSWIVPLSLFDINEKNVPFFLMNPIPIKNL